MQQEERYVIVTTANEQFLPHAAVMIYSVLQTKHPDTRIDFYLLDDGVTLETKARLNKMLSDDRSSIAYLEVDKNQYASYVSNERFPSAVYHRISIPSLLEKTDYTRALYIDGDMVAAADLTELLSVNLQDSVIGAVEDSGFHPRLEKMGIHSKSGKYFNSGMMLIDLEKWRSEDISQQTFTFIQEHSEKLVFFDQDALNAILHDKWLPLHPKFNAQTMMLTKETTHPDPEGERLCQEARKEPVLIHFNGVHKPDHPDCQHPYVDLYREYRQYTPFPL